MTGDDHVDLDTLADVEAGLTDPPTAARVEEHLSGCETCRDRARSLDEAAAALRAIPSPGMPDDVATRIDTALRAAAGASPTVVPLDAARRTRRGVRLAGLAAAAAAVALVGALVASHAVGGSTGGAGSDAGEANSSATSAHATATAGDARALRAVEHTRLPGFTSADLADQVTVELSGTARAPRSGAVPQARRYTTAKGSLRHRSARDDATASAVSALQPLHSPARMFACIRQLTEFPGITVPLRVDFTTYAGKPAVVVVVPDRYATGQATAYVAGPTCGAPDAVSGGFITYRGAIPR